MRTVFNRYPRLHPIIYFCVELLLLSTAVLLAAVVRFSGEGLSWRSGVPYLPHAFLMTLVCQMCMYYTDLYDVRVALSGSKLFFKLLRALTAATVALAVLFYLLPQLVIGRGVLLLGMGIGFGCVGGWRLLMQRLQALERFRVNVLILGTGAEAKRVAQELLDKRSLGYEVKGFIDDDVAKLGVSVVNPKVIGTSEHLPEIVTRERIDRIVVALPERRGKLPLEALLACKLRGVEVEEGTTFYEQLNGKVMLDHLRPSWMIFSQGFSVSSLTLLLKRLLDVCCAGTGLVCAVPLGLIITALIKLDSPGPVFFTQQRVGQHGRLFTLIKFRSMQANAEAATGPVYADENDCRITRVGRLLRTTRLDELPQLLNVLTGEMSFVGPRPERPFFVKQYEKEIPYYGQRLSVKPGITGWAQINYHYGANADDTVEKLQYDLYYIKNLSLFLDLFILLKTAKIVLLGQGAR